jgi:hypothetical protein
MNRPIPLIARRDSLETAERESWTHVLAAHLLAGSQRGDASRILKSAWPRRRQGARDSARCGVANFDDNELTPCA